MTINKPIVFDQKVNVRFEDMDPNGHISTSKYIDLVFQSRWIYLEENFAWNLEASTAQGIAFLVRRLEIDYVSPAVNCSAVRIKSFVSERKKTSFLVEFEIANRDLTSTFAKGLVKVAVIDIATAKPTKMPLEIDQMLFEN